MPVFTAGILVSSPLQSLNLQPSPEASSSFVFTRVVPEDNFVAHIVEKGDTLKSLADNYYGDEKYWVNLWNENPEIADPDKPQEELLIKLQVIGTEKVEKLTPELNKKLEEITAKSQTPPAFFSKPVYPIPLSSYEEVYKAAGAKYGVPWQILYGLHYTETGFRDGVIFNGQGSGAQGPMQFMPGTWRAYGVDGDSDGVADINKAVDAIYTAANFLAQHGSLENGLRAYGGNTQGVLSAARSKGYMN
jgi:hypothetical protein